MRRAVLAALSSSSTARELADHPAEPIFPGSVNEAFGLALALLSSPTISSSSSTVA
jgi:hypothetical protein